ncbi:MAG: hypothetical protein EOP84_04445 [Verrucomicrobiaceae bacterium]|nr:MAG: hypothetical protein EOP84_04445 [Verrucomicrobiaceae bacterium]
MKKPGNKRQTGNPAPRRVTGGKRAGWLGTMWRYMLTFTDWPQWFAIIGFILFAILWLGGRHLIGLGIEAVLPPAD